MFRQLWRGVLLAGLIAAPAWAQFGNQTVYTWRRSANNIVAGNFNSDRYSPDKLWDIGVTGTREETERRWLLRVGSGDGSFRYDEKVVNWGNGVTNAFSGDFDGDGAWDLGVTGTANENDRCWYIRYGKNQWMRQTETKYCWGNGATEVVTGDFDGDRRWDIAVVEFSGGNATFYIRYSDGTGQFGRQTVYTWAGVRGTKPFAGDFDGDGFSDIGVTGSDARPNGGVWYFRLNDHNKGFGNEFTYNWGNGDNNILTGDFNGDGLYDIAVTGTRARPNNQLFIRYNLMKRPTPAPENPGPCANATLSAILRRKYKQNTLQGNGEQGLCNPRLYGNSIQSDEVTNVLNRLEKEMLAFSPNLTQLIDSGRGSSTPGQPGVYPLSSVYIGPANSAPANRQRWFNMLLPNGYLLTFNRILCGGTDGGTGPLCATGAF